MTREGVLAEARPVLLRMTLVSYGKCAALEKSRGGESDSIGPPGEGEPMAERWGRLIFEARTTEAAAAYLEEARAELAAWIRRPFVQDQTESLDELQARIVADGWNLSAAECALAMRCTPTLVRRARLVHDRHPETGRALPERQSDPMNWARALDSVGLSLRQIEAITGLSRSTLHRAF